MVRFFRLETLLGVLALVQSLNIDISLARRDAVKRVFTIASGVLGTATVVFPDLVARAIDEEQQADRISDAEIKEIVKNDILERQFLVTGNLTPRIYRPKALFTDEIDTYQMDQWMSGTQKLFVGEKSEVRLVGDIIVTPEQVEFRFDEDLMFRIPFRPTVSLTGKVVLMRDDAGYITSYQEFWDQDVFTVLKSAKF
ncbi:hypothetical protein ACA910_013645 [Epithemia clementina (nom. ined.)]